LGFGEPPSAPELSGAEILPDDALASMTAGINASHGAVLETVFFGSDVSLTDSLTEYAEAMAEFSEGVRGLSSAFLPEGEYTTFVPIALPGLFIPAGSEVSWNGSRLVAESPGIYAVVGEQFVTVNQVSLSLDDVQNSLSGNVASFENGEGFAINNFESVTAADGSSSSLSADSLLYVSGGEQFVFYGVQAGHSGDSASASAALVDIDSEVADLTATGAFLNESPGELSGGASDVDLASQEFTLQADVVRFTRADSEDGTESFDGVASGNVSLVVGNDVNIVTDSLLVSTERSGDDSTVVFRTEGPTSGTLDGKPLSASEGFTITSEVVDGEQHAYSLAYAGDLSYDFSDGDPTLDEPLVTGTNGIIRVENDSLTFTGESIRLSGEEGELEGNRLVAVYDTSGESTTLLSVQGWSQADPSLRPPGATEGPSSVSGELEGYAISSSNLHHLEIEQNDESGQLSRLSFAGEGIALSPTEAALAEGDSDFDLTSDGLVSGSLVAHEDTGTLALAQVSADDLTYSDSDVRVQINESRGEDN
ncbi:MAG: hypothetical protein AAFY60_12600, partial [Myxococcota bacterium]